MFKKGILLAVSVLTTYGVCAQQQVLLDKVVAVVGGSSILYSEVENYATQLKEERRREGYTSDRDPKNEALEMLMTQKLLFNQAQIDSIPVNLADIASRVEMQLQEMAEEVGGIAQLEKREHLAIFNVRKMLRENYEEQAYAGSMRNEVVSKVKIIPGEVDRFYKRINKDSLPMIPEQYVYAQITRLPKTVVQAKQRAKERLLEMRERIIKGESQFEMLARMYSQDGTAMRGGEMPQPMLLNQLDATVAGTLEKLKPGQISEVIESQFGFHIIQLIEKRGVYYRFRHILLRPAYTDEELAATMNTLDSLARLIRTDSITFDKAAADFSDDAHSKMNGGLVSNHDILEHYSVSDPKLTQTAFRKEDFGNFNKLDDYNALRYLKLNEISPAFLTEGIAGNDQMAKIVKLVQIIPTHRASLNEDYLRLEEIALRDKQDRAFNEWLSKKIESMYVFIVPEFRNGEFMNKNWVK